MKVDIFIELYIKLKELGIDPNILSKKTGEYLTDEQITEILNENYDKIKFEIVMQLNMKPMFNNYSKKTQDKIVELLSKVNKNITGVLNLFDSDILFEDEEKLLEIIKLITTNSKGAEQAFYASNLAKIPEILERSNAFEFIEIIATAKGNQTILASNVAMDPDVLKSQIALDLVKIIATAEEEYQAEYASEVATDPEVLKSQIALDLVKIIATAEEEYQAEYASYVAQDPDVLESPLALELTKIVAEAKKDYQSGYASYVARDPDVLESPLALELTKVVAEAKKDYQSKYASYVAQNKDVLTSPIAIELVDHIANNDINKIPKYNKEELLSKISANHLKRNFFEKLLDIAFNEKGLRTKKSYDYIRKILNAQTEKKINLHYSSFLNEIKELEVKETTEYKKENTINFWELYKTSPAEAVDYLTLADYIDELTKDTFVKTKK